MANEDIMIWSPNAREQDWLNNHNDFRTYEVSIWTLQDDFITILKHSNLENKGQIQEPKLKLDIDGTSEFTFNIPMYLYNAETNQLEENPIWYNVYNGNIAVNMRKIKLIFNKNKPEEKVFEFLITIIDEAHSDDELLCSITSEGLAFHELGKIGYKINLSAQDFYNYYDDWIDRRDTAIKNGERFDESEPIANIQYWLGKLGLSSSFTSSKTWYYEINMDYNSYPKLKDSYDNPVARNTHIVYEEAYPASWDIENEELVTIRIEECKEKARLVELKESNIYNLTQDIAKLFGIFCRYEYSYDDNYHIIERKIVFYNNFYYESQGFIDLTYPYQTSEITRTIDGSDLITKMYVKSVDDSTTAAGLLTILNTKANKSGEDYLLNFDYLYKIKTISKEQYEEVSVYEKDMHDFNAQLIPLESIIIALEDQLPDLEAKEKIATNAIQLDTERLSAANNLLNTLTEGRGELEITPNNPDSAVLLEDSSRSGSNSYYINLSKHGIDPQSIRVFRYFDVTKTQSISTDVGDETYELTHHNGRLYCELKTGQLEYDEFGDVTRIRNLYLSSILGNEDHRTIFLIYKYTPQLYYDKVIKTWTERLAKDTKDQSLYQERINNINNNLDLRKAEYESILNNKKARIKNFDAIMGPALREGYWAPENYKDCGDSYTDEINLTNTLTSSYYDNRISNERLINHFLWDSELFPDEDKCTYEEGTAQTRKNYPCINLTRFSQYLYNSNWSKDQIKNRINNLSIFFYDYSGTTSYNVTPNVISPGSMRSFSVGSQCQYGFIERNGGIYPVLILTGFETLPEYLNTTRVIQTSAGNYEQSSTSESMINFLKSKGMYLGQLKVKADQTVDFEWHLQIEPSDWIEGSNYVTVYPRMQIDSLGLKTSSDQLIVYYNKNKLTNIEDYYCLSKIPNNTNGNVNNNADAAYFITLKPEAVFKYGGTEINKIFAIRYSITNADTSIYLDAKEVLKENAYPKVSYTIKVNRVNPAFLKDIYNKLSYITHINDSDLKFEDMMGYISSINLQLDKPWNDEIEIKNYKTKFEDLFSSIIASTEEMKKTSQVISTISSNFDAYGSLQPWTLEETIYKADLDYAFNQGKLTIDEQNGIWGVSASGVVAIRGGGIFTATEQDDSGNWKWNTGITPEGINASLMTTGQLDTNRIMIYAGNKLRFQFNGDGLFAYKSFFEDMATISTWVAAGLTSSQQTYVEDINEKINGGYYDTVTQKFIATTNTNADLDVAQYVLINENGLQLIAKPGALVLNSDKTNYVQINKTLFDWIPSTGGNKYQLNIPEEGIKRVSISWDGFKLKNYYNQDVFYADADTGNLSIKGTIYASELNLGGKTEGSSITLNEYFGEPNNLIINGLTSSVILNIFTKSVTRVFYMSESELSTYLSSGIASAGDIWFNTNAISDDYTLFIIGTNGNSSSNIYDNWNMTQISRNDYNRNNVLTKALLGIYQATLNGEKYITVYKGEAITDTMITKTYSATTSQIEFTETEDTLTATVTDYEDVNGTSVLDDLPVEEQTLDLTEVNVNNVSVFKYGDIWINIDSNNTLVGLYHWESDYVNEYTNTLGKWVLITSTAALTIKDSTSSKLANARTTIQKIANGEHGLVFKNSEDIAEIQLNKKVGLYIKSREDSCFKVNSSEFAFLKGTTPYLYYRDGNLYIMGTIFAKSFYVYDKGQELTNNVTNYVTYNTPSTTSTNEQASYKRTLNEYLAYDFATKEVTSDVFKNATAGIINSAAEGLEDVNADNYSILEDFRNAINTHLYSKQTGIAIESGGITIAATKYIKLGVSGTVSGNDSSSFSGIQLSNTGIWLGSNTAINLFSGNSANEAASLRIMPSQILLGVADQNNSSVVKMTSNEIIVGTQSVANGSTSVSGIIIHPSELTMGTAGTVQLMGTTGKIQFGTNDDINFRVDEEGNVYCKSLTCTNGDGAVINNNSSTVPSNITNDYKVTWGQSGQITFNSSNSQGTLTLYTSNSITEAGSYILEVTLNKVGSGQAYFPIVTARIGSVISSSSLAFTGNKASTVLKFSMNLPITSSSNLNLALGFKYDQSSGTNFNSNTTGSLNYGVGGISSPIGSASGTTSSGSITLTASAVLYPNFKLGSTVGMVAGEWSSNGTYTVKNKITGQTLSTISINSGWTNNSYSVNANAISGKESQSTSFSVGTTVSGEQSGIHYSIKAVNNTNGTDSGSTNISTETISGEVTGEDSHEYQTIISPNTATTLSSGSSQTVYSYLQKRLKSGGSWETVSGATKSVTITAEAASGTGEGVSQSTYNTLLGKYNNLLELVLNLYTDLGNNSNEDTGIAKVWITQAADGSYPIISTRTRAYNETDNSTYHFYHLNNYSDYPNYQQIELKNVIRNLT